LIGALLINLSETVTVYAIAVYWIIFILFLVFAGNYLIYKWLDKTLPWEEDTLRRVLIQLLASGIYTIICTNLSYFLFKSNLTESPPDGQQMTLLNVYAVFIIIPVFSIFFGIYFLTKWKKATIVIEEAKKEAIRTELLALKNHLDPHFLFNNLNILSSLIDDESKSAQLFLEKFSEVYRYLLKNKDSEVIQIKSEIDFLDSYMFLINMRFEDQLEFDQDIDENILDKYIPTLTVQMLVENAIKHNKFSSASKLIVRIKTENSHLIISNNYRPKVAKSYQNSSGSGIRNIEKRYELLSDKKPVITIEDGFFIVKLPILKKY